MFLYCLDLKISEIYFSVSLILIQSTMAKCQFELNFIQLATISNLFLFKVVQNINVANSVETEKLEYTADLQNSITRYVLFFGAPFIHADSLEFTKTLQHCVGL